LLPISSVILWKPFFTVFIFKVIHSLLEISIYSNLPLKGTRTLVDNLDYGTNALMPGGRYSGIFDCFGAIIRKEGLWTLFRFKSSNIFIILVYNFFSGVGAVFLQYALQNCLSIFVYWALDRGILTLQCLQLLCFFEGTRGYTSGPLRIKPITPIGIDIPTFNSVEAEQRNDSQFAQSSAQVEFFRYYSFTTP
jgi:hypothetical protein